MKSTDIVLDLIAMRFPVETVIIRLILEIAPETRAITLDQLFKNARIQKPMTDEEKIQHEKASAIYFAKHGIPMKEPEPRYIEISKETLVKGLDHLVKKKLVYVLRPEIRIHGSLLHQLRPGEIFEPREEHEKSQWKFDPDSPDVYVLEELMSVADLSKLYAWIKEWKQEQPKKRRSKQVESTLVLRLRREEKSKYVNICLLCDIC